MVKKRRREVDPLIAEIMDKYNIENVLDLQSIRVCLIFCVNLQISVNYNYINLEVFL